MKYFYTLFVLLLLSAACETPGTSVPTSSELDPSNFIELDLKKADYLYHFAYDCIDREYPNKLGQVLGDSSYLAEPSALHPAFYGCFDWHSSVHGHWTLVTLLSQFPNFEQHEAILAKLKTNLTKENIEREVAYFQDEHNKNFERTYGWAWLLKLDEALQAWKHPEANRMHKNLKPLVDLIAGKYIAFLDKLNYPIRVGEHPNTAFGLAFAYEYAIKHDKNLANRIAEKAKVYYLQDSGCPLIWEPGGFDFLSPCLQEAILMKKILPLDEFKLWLNTFLPDFQENPARFLEVATVSDRSDGKLAHLDGLNFSRAWCLYEIGQALGNDKMLALAKKHFDYSYTKMDSGEYAGAHWLASFAAYAILKGSK